MRTSAVPVIFTPSLRKTNAMLGPPVPPAAAPTRLPAVGRGRPTTAVARNSSPTIVASVIVAPSSPPRNGRIVPVMRPSTTCSSSVTGCSLLAPGGGLLIAHACVPTHVPTKRAAGTAAGVWAITAVAINRKLPTPNAQRSRVVRGHMARDPTANLTGRAKRAHVLSVFAWTLQPVDHENLYGRSIRLQLETKLFLERGEDRRRVLCGRGRAWSKSRQR